MRNGKSCAKRFLFGMVLSGVFSCVFSCGAWAEAPAAGQGRVFRSDGDVRLKTSSGKSVKVAGNETLGPGDEIETGPGSQCRVYFESGQKSSVKMDGSSRLEIVSSDGVKLSLREGRVLAVVRDLKKGSTFEVVTPVAVASARGTAFSASAEGRFEVFEDAIRVVSGNRTAEVEEGRGILVEKGGVFREFELASDVLERARREAAEIAQDMTASQEAGTDSEMEETHERAQSAQEVRADASEENHEVTAEKNRGGSTTSSGGGQGSV